MGRQHFALNISKQIQEAVHIGCKSFERWHSNVWNLLFELSKNCYKNDVIELSMFVK